MSSIPLFLQHENPPSILLTMALSLMQNATMSFYAGNNRSKGGDSNNGNYDYDSSTDGVCENKMIAKTLARKKAMTMMVAKRYNGYDGYDNSHGDDGKIGSNNNDDSNYKNDGNNN